MEKIKVKNKFLYWALIGTFTTLYLAVAFVSTLHAITFFQLANTLSLAILLGAAYEIGQSSVLFAILLTENKNKMLAWGMMILLTALQVTANVYASFKFMDISGSTDWTYWQRSILFSVQADEPEMYKVIISWITGALLPLVALGMTALVAENIRLMRGEKLGDEEEDETTIPKEKADEIINNEVSRRLEKEKESKSLKEKLKQLWKGTDDEIEQRLWKGTDDEIELDTTKEEKVDNKIDKVLDEKNEDQKLEKMPETEKVEKVEEDKKEIKTIKKPVNTQRGWHFKNEFIDDDGNVFRKGKYSYTIDKDKSPPSKKA